MKFFCQLVFLSILIPLSSSAQSNYKSGYVVRLQGDTIKGYVNFREWGQNPQSLDFKNTQGEKTEYSSKNIRGFGINGYDAYRRFVVSISMGKVNIDNLTSTPDTTTRTDTVFLKQITAGKYLTLYCYIDNLKERYYISDKNETPVELIQRLYLNSAISTVVTQKYYLHQLENYASAYKPGDENLINHIQSANYTDGELQAIVNGINGEKNKSLKESGAVRFFAGLLFVNSSTSAHGNTEFAGDKSASAFPGVSLGIDILPNKDVQAFFFRLELAYTQSKANFSYANTSYETTLALKHSAASFNPQVMLNVYNTNPCRIYISAGFLLNYSVYTDKSYMLTVPGSPAQSLGPPEFPALGYSYNAKIGILLNNKIEIYASYIPPAPLNDDIGFRIDETQYRAGINYLFTK